MPNQTIHFIELGSHIPSIPNRKITHRPAVTRVLLCTKALTGVGAAMAAGNHLINGNWALLVNAAITQRKKHQKGQLDCQLKQSFPINTKTGNNIRKITSPIRFVNRVRKEQSTEYFLE
jgi:hypothetical protein